MLTALGITVIFLAGHAVGYAPSISANIASIVTQAAAGAAIVVQSRYRSAYSPSECHYLRGTVC